MTVLTSVTTSAINQAPNQTTFDYRQETTNQPTLFQVPREILKEIAEFVVADSDPVKSAKYAISFSKVSKYTNLIVKTHTKIVNLFNNAKAVIYANKVSLNKWINDASNPLIQHYVDSNGKILSTKKFMMHM